MEPRLPSKLSALLGRYLVLLDRWNRTHALTALPAGERKEELLLDASVLLPFLDQVPPGSRVADLGTGMGVPAEVLALARPDLEVLGVDASTKKLAFLRQVEELAPLDADWGTAKALGSLGVLAGWWARHGRPGCPFFALKGPDWAEEPPPRGWNITPHPYQLPTRGQRTLIELRLIQAGTEG